VESHTLGETYELGAAQPYAYADPIGTLTGGVDPKNENLSREGWRIDLMGVYRLGSDRVLVEVRLNADEAAVPDLSALADPDFSWWVHLNDRDNGGYAGAPYEFSDVKLTVAGDDTSYRAVRTETNFCLCSMNNANMKEYDFGGGGDYPAYVVMSAPEGASTVTLTIPYVGSFENVAIEPSLPQRDLVPAFAGYQLRLVSLERAAAGTVTARVAVERPADGPNRLLGQLDGASPWDSKHFSQTVFENLLAVDADGVWGGWQPANETAQCPSCTDAYGPKVGEGVEIEITSPDPGTQDLLFGGTVGWLFSPRTVEGTPTKATEDVFEYYFAQTSPGLRAAEKIELDTTVLFATDKATLSKSASKTLDKAAKILKAQDGRKLRIVGHTDSTGSDSHNLDLSKRRAKAVADALKQRLGSGWTFETDGKGEKDPRVKETGLNGKDLENARRLNRRVEITIID
jgi:outer membrane protein OmpA-like peptidoglycan-associated protein